MQFHASILFIQKNILNVMCNWIELAAMPTVLLFGIFKTCYSLMLVYRKCAD